MIMSDNRKRTVLKIDVIVYYYFAATFDINKALNMPPDIGKQSFLRLKMVLSVCI